MSASATQGGHNYHKLLYCFFVIMLMYMWHDYRCKAVSGDSLKSSRTVMLVQNSDPCKLIVSIIQLVTLSFARLFFASSPGSLQSRVL